MEHGQIFHVVLNTILEYKSKFQGSVLEFQDTVLPVLLDTDVTSNVLLDPILILHVQGMALGPLTLLVPGIWEKLKMAVMVALGLMEENVTEQLKLFWVCIYVLKFIYFEKNNFFCQITHLLWHYFFYFIKERGWAHKKSVVFSQNLNFNMTKVVEQIILGHSKILAHFYKMPNLIFSKMILLNRILDKLNAVNLFFFLKSSLIALLFPIIISLLEPNLSTKSCSLFNVSQKIFLIFFSQIS